MQKLSVLMFRSQQCETSTAICTSVGRRVPLPVSSNIFVMVLGRSESRGNGELDGAVIVSSWSKGGAIDNCRRLGLLSATRLPLLPRPPKSMNFQTSRYEYRFTWQ